MEWVTLLIQRNEPTLLLIAFCWCMYVYFVGVRDVCILLVYVVYVCVEPSI